MKIAVVGAGAMGSLFGGLLSAVAEVTLVDPWREHVEAVNRQGLHLDEREGTKSIQVAATTDPASVHDADLAIIFVKSHQTEMAGRMAAQLLTPTGLALTMQNGLGNGEVLAGIVGAARVWQGVTSQGATLLGPGHVRHAGYGASHLETRPEIATTAQRVAQLFEKAGFETHLSEDLDALVWGKLVVNVGINALTALLRVPNGSLAEFPAANHLLAAAVEEAVQVATAKGIQLPYADPVAHVTEIARITASNRSSMLQDTLRGGRTEVEVMNGAIVREGQKLGLRVPYNQALLELVRALEATHAARV